MYILITRTSTSMTDGLLDIISTVKMAEPGANGDFPVVNVFSMNCWGVSSKPSSFEGLS